MNSIRKWLYRPKVIVMTLIFCCFADDKTAAVVVAELRLYIFFFDLAESKVAVFLCSILTSDGVPFSFGKNSFP